MWIIMVCSGVMGSLEAAICLRLKSKARIVIKLEVCNS